MNTTLEFIEKNGLCATDKVCVFCSTITDGWNAICYSCGEYKGMMRITEAIDYYGTDIVGL